MVEAEHEAEATFDGSDTLEGTWVDKRIYSNASDAHT